MPNHPNKPYVPHRILSVQSQIKLRHTNTIVVFDQTEFSIDGSHFIWPNEHIENEHFIVLLRTIKYIPSLMRYMKTIQKASILFEILSFFPEIDLKNKHLNIKHTNSNDCNYNCLSYFWNVLTVRCEMWKKKLFYIYLEMFLWLSTITRWKYTIQILKHSAKCLSNWYVSCV